MPVESRPLTNERAASPRRSRKSAPYVAGTRRVPL